MVWEVTLIIPRSSLFFQNQRFLLLSLSLLLKQDVPFFFLLFSFQSLILSYSRILLFLFSFFVKKKKKPFFLQASPCLFLYQNLFSTSSFLLKKRNLPQSTFINPLNTFPNFSFSKHFPMWQLAYLSSALQFFS